MENIRCTQKSAQIGGLVISPSGDVYLFRGEVREGETTQEAFVRELGFPCKSIYFATYFEENTSIVLDFIGILEQDFGLSFIDPNEALSSEIPSHDRALIKWYLEMPPFASLTLRCDQLPVLCSVGILAHEMEKKQTLYISAQLELKGAETADYRIIADLITEIALIQHYPLIEELAQSLIEQFHQSFSCNAVKISIEKPSAIEGAKCAAIEMTSRRPL